MYPHSIRQPDRTLIPGAPSSLTPPSRLSRTALYSLLSRLAACRVHCGTTVASFVYAATWHLATPVSVPDIPSRGI